MGFTGTKLAPRHMLIAYMQACGLKNVEIARRLGLNANYLSMVTNSPLFKVQVADIQKQIRDGAIEDVLDLIRLEGASSVQKLIELRDSGVQESTQLAAANSLLDRGAAPKRAHISEDRTLRIVVSRDEIAVMQQAMQDAGLTIDISPAPSRGRMLADVPDEE